MPPLDANGGTPMVGGTSTLPVAQLRAALQAVQAVGDITVSMAISLLTVAMFERRSLREYAEMLELPTSTMSRHLLDLGIRTRKREPGLGLIDQGTDPEDSRKNVYRLTPKGRKLIDEITRRLT